MLIHCIYWEDKYLKLVTKKYLKKHLAMQKLFRLIAISDVTCDFRGSIDILSIFSTIDKPFFVYKPDVGEIDKDYWNAKEGILYNSIENMPTEFPLDASENFGRNLTPFIERILKSDITKPLKDQNLPLEIRKAVITWDGKLTDNFIYINKLRR